MSEESLAERRESPHMRPHLASMLHPAADRLSHCILHHFWRFEHSKDRQLILGVRFHGQVFIFQQMHG